MIKIILRTMKDNTWGVLALCVKSRKLGVNTDISLHCKIKTKDFVIKSGLPKRYDVRPVKELHGLSYAQLTDRLHKIIRVLSAAEEEGTLTVDMARNVARNVITQEAPEIGLTRASKCMTLKDFISEYISDCESGKRLKKKSTRRIAPLTIKGYKGFLSQLIAYQESRHKVIEFSDVDMDFYHDFCQFFLEKKYSPNTIARHIRILKIMMYAAKDMKLTDNLDFTCSDFAANWEDVDNVYLTDDMVQQMYSLVITDDTIKNFVGNLPESEQDLWKRKLRRADTKKLLNEAKDIFTVGCLTGQRVSDYKRIDKSMYKTLRDGKQYIMITQEKTGKTIYIPGDERVKVILNRYNGKLPHIYDQDLNERIKIIGRILGWTQVAGITVRKGLMEYKSKKKFYECIKTHTARRTFATNAYKAGVPLSAIMAVTGHSSEAMLKRYLKLDDKERAILASAEFNKAMGS